MAVTFAVLCFNPWPIMMKDERIQLIKTLEQILIAPIGQVKFRHFFLADIITSITSILQQFGNIYLFFTSDKQGWLTGKAESVSQTNWFGVYVVVQMIGFIPAWFRFAQCCRRYYTLKVEKNPTAHMQLYNALKYLSGLVAQLAECWFVRYQFDTAFVVWIVLKIFATMFAYIWDLRVDWGLTRYWSC